MCGIFGVFNVDRKIYANNDEFIAAIEQVEHRGPDNISYFSTDSCFLGHARLSILDVGKASNQPFEFEDLVVIYNGEVFNYIELMDELTKKGYVFNTTSDTEVVTKAFHYWGTDCFSKFNGMWAIIIHNKKSQKTIISRDRFGQKPLFVLRKNNSIFLASEVQQLVKFSSRETNYAVIQKFLEEGAFIHDNQTFFNDIEIFPKAFYAELDTRGHLTLSQYWHYWSGPITKVTNECLLEFEHLLEDSIKIRLRADVPFGILLSGGLDSTLIAAYIRKYIDQNTSISAFTYSSQDLDDESKFAASVAEKLNLSLTIVNQDANPENYLTRLRQLVKHLGRGHSSLAITSIDKVLESASNAGCKIAIDGQGADELLAGYCTYHPLAIFSFLVRGNFRQALCFVKSLMNQGLIITTTLFLRNILPEKMKSVGRFFYGHGQFLKKQPTSDSDSLIKNKFFIKKNSNLLNRYLISQHDIGLENLLFYGDIVAMKNSIENRSPFLDHRLVDFTFSKDEKLKLWNGVDKYALRSSSFSHIFSVEFNRKKIGFSSAIKRKTTERMLEDIKKSPILKWKIFSKKLIQSIDSGEITAIKRHETFFFRLYQVHLWAEIFIYDKD